MPGTQSSYHHWALAAGTCPGPTSVRTPLRGTLHQCPRPISVPASDPTLLPLQAHKETASMYQARRQSGCAFETLAARRLELTAECPSQGLLKLRQRRFCRHPSRCHSHCHRGGAVHGPPGSYVAEGRRHAPKETERSCSMDVLQASVMHMTGQGLVRAVAARVVERVAMCVCRNKASCWRAAT